MGETTALRLKRVEKRARAASDVDRLPLGDIRKVELMFEDGSPQSYFVHKDDVETLIKATSVAVFNSADQAAIAFEMEGRRR